MRTYTVIPVAMKAVRVQTQVRELSVSDFPAHGVAASVEPACDLETLGRGRVGDQLHDRLIVAKWLTPPVRGDEREEPVLDLIPLARARWEVTYANGKVSLIGELLQLQLPEPEPVAVAAATVRGDQQASGPGVQVFSTR